MERLGRSILALACRAASLIGIQEVNQLDPKTRSDDLEHGTLHSPANRTPTEMQARIPRARHDGQCSVIAHRHNQ